MAQVLSLKELRTSSVLKSEIAKLEEERTQLLDQLERARQVEKKLRDDLLDHKKDFEHLERQFDHFAGVEAEFEALQQQVQLDRLEQLIDGDKKDTALNAQLKKARDELKTTQDELKELKQLDPERLKRQVADLKKKTQQQSTDNQNLNTALVKARKELKDLTGEKEKFEGELKASRNGTDFFWQSVDGIWVLYESSVVLKDEKVDDPDKYKRIRCLHTLTGMSALSSGKDDNDKALWLGTLEIPDDVTVEAGKRLLSIAAELDENKGKE
jgi:DNA repair exonuclease SbcCD ATPase subunit